MNTTQTHWEEPVSLTHRLAEIREMQGKEPLPDPGVIQGFEPGAPPPPPYVPRNDYDDEDSGDIESPMIPKTDFAVRKNPPKPVNMPSVATSGSIEGLDLIVVETEAAYKGHAVTLNEAERASIAKIILLASRRILDERLSEVEKPRASNPAVTPAAVFTKKRGRPKKS